MNRNNDNIPVTDLKGNKFMRRPDLTSSARLYIIIEELWRIEQPCLCGYLSDASEVCSHLNSSAFFNGQKQLAEEGRMTEVIRQTEPYTGSASVPGSKAPVRRCIRCIRNRAGQSDYKEAAENGLPTGSGEIESAHRYIIQKRLKIAGAWRAENNAQNMISLRVLRANGDRESYWENIKAA